MWLKGGNSALPGFGCPLRALTGIPCPSCFLTRATCASLRGQWSEALDLHAFGPIAAAALVVWSLEAIRQRHLVPHWLRGWQVVTATAALLGYWSLRLLLHYGLGITAFPSG
ncbi:DUF2752 domain-containing protein [Synechococcus sp. J7-Johnson]|uniref:DUF2752 domain-containing protein n=1 Tax=Synechococcus sp. J7-Johnson TaxID=2823737 RepID=UPI0020CE0EE1|nr:DUF2752 domain-containing protein [Synechococcus sp. J7-Johnson]MCP9839111.1 DUF2752 domain-containing protein [Synechococcus sp. J7-Johnson]